MLKRLSPLCLSAIIFAADLATKEAILEAFRWRQTPIEITSFFQLILTFNRGASFGFLNNGTQWAFWGLTIAVCGVLLYLLYWLFTEKDTPTRLSLSLIIGGAIGNLYDRLARGAVVDFLDVFWQDYHWPAFNIADSFIVIGVCCLLLITFLKEVKK